MSVLTLNIEVAYNVTKSEIKQLDKVDIEFLQRTMFATAKVSRCILLLELGLVSVEYLIKQKCLGFLHHLLSSNDSSLAYQVLMEQRKTQLKGDWVNLVSEDLQSLKMFLSFDDISRMPKGKFKELVKKSCEKACFNSLLKEKNILSKGREIQYSCLMTQSYLKPESSLVIDDMRWIFSVRSRDIDLRANFPNKNNDTSCVFKDCLERETQAHFWSCSYYGRKGEVADGEVKYEDIFSDSPQKQEGVIRIIQQRYSRREQVLKDNC